MNFGCLVIACALLLGSVCLLLHHGWVHARCEDDRARQESCVWCCFFQLSNIQHFETWIIVFLTNGTTLGLAAILVKGHLVLMAMAAGCCVGALLLILVHAMACVETNEESSQDILRNVSNHETWILVAFTNAGSMLALFVLSP